MIFDSIGMMIIQIYQLGFTHRNKYMFTHKSQYVYQKTMASAREGPCGGSKIESRRYHIIQDIIPNSFHNLSTIYFFKIFII